MFNSDSKERAIRLVKKAAKEYEAEFEKVKDKSTELFDLRTLSKEEIIIPVENFINNLANSPKEFKKSIGALEIEYNKFENEIIYLERESQEIDFKAGRTAVAGVVTGVGAARAAGMAGGSALLALAGPISWGIGISGLIGGGLLASSKNKKIAEKANDQRYDIEKGIQKFKRAIIEIDGTVKSTNKHSKGIKDLLDILTKYAPKNYLEYNQREKEILASLINHIQGLSNLINQKVKV